MLLEQDYENMNQWQRDLEKEDMERAHKAREAVFNTPNRHGHRDAINQLLVCGRSVLINTGGSTFGRGVVHRSTRKLVKVFRYHQAQDGSWFWNGDLMSCFPNRLVQVPIPSIEGDAFADSDSTPAGEDPEA